MFSNLSNFIPSALQQTFTTPFDKDKDPPQVNVHNYEQRDESVSINDDTKQMLKKDKKGPNETFIVVRPPPAKSNHPLNLQVQLVPPNTRTPAGVASTRVSEDLERPPASDSASESTGPPLSRVSSNRSDYSGYGSTTSFASFSSNANSSNRRTIIPLYSLQAHNVMTNVIVDAGTDAKIARFNKRGIEMVDLANLEPTEVWAGATKDMVLQAAPSSTDALPITTNKRSSLSLKPRPITADRSSTASALEPKLDAMLATGGNTTPQKRNFFNKIFNKKPKDLDLSSSNSVTSPLNTPSTPDRDRTPRKQPSILQSSPTVFKDEPPPTPSAQLRPPVLGIQPVLSAPPGQYPPIGRPALYVWSVRRWTKTNDQSILGKLSNLNPTGGTITPITTDVRFEWKRGKTKKERKPREKGSGGSRETSVSRPTTPGTSTTSLNDTPKPCAGLMVQDRKNSNRLSVISHMSAATTAEGQDYEGDGDGDGDESDPEDSETPWTCTLKVKKDDQVLRIKVGNMSPTPHHPKVVAMLKVPFPLPDIEIDLVTQIKREVASNGAVLRNEPNPKGGIRLTAEEIKDIVACTGMWVIVREGFGGVGKVSRKGDGWRIRA